MGGSSEPWLLAPAELRCDVLEDALDRVSVVVNAKLVWHGQQQRVGRGDRLVLGKLLDQDVGLAA